MESRQRYISAQSDIKLFAEALVSFIIDDVFEEYYPSDETERFNEETCMQLVFNEAMKRAVKCIYMKEIKNFSPLRTFRQFHRCDEGAFFLTVYQILEEFSNNDVALHFQAEMFLYGCVEITIYAKLFKDNGLRNAPDIAVPKICALLEGYFATRGRWDAFNNAAKEICENIPCDDTITAKSFFPEMAESKLQITTFEPSSSGTHSHCAEPRMMDKNDVIFSHGSGEESEMQVDDPEHISGISENKSSQHFQFPNVSVQKRHLETDDDDGSIGLAKKARLNLN